MAQPATTLPSICFNLFESQQQLGYALRTHASQEKIKEIMAKITKDYEAFDAYREAAKEDTQFLGLKRKTWNWLKLGACGFTFLGSLAPLVASVVTTVEANNNNCTQSIPTLATNIFSATFALLIGSAMGTYEAIDALRKGYEEAQDLKLSEAHSLSKFWKIYQDFELQHKENTNTSIQMDTDNLQTKLVKIKNLFEEIKVTPDPNLESELENRIKFEIEQTNDLKNRLLSLLVQVFPKENETKKAFTDNQKIEKDLKENTLIVNEESGSTSYRNGFLDVKTADKEPLNSPNRSNFVSSEDLHEKYQGNLSFLSEEWGFSVTTKLYNDSPEKLPELNLQNEI